MLIYISNYFSFIARYNSDSKQFFYCRTVLEIFKRFRRLSERPANLNVPYFIIQPRLANVKEYKVCILTNSFTGEEGKPFLCINPHPKGKAFINPFDHTRLYEFVQRAKSLYEEKVSTLVSPILRIDIMITQFGKLVVNEFESLEAYIHAGVRGSQQRDTLDSLSEQHLERFWYMQLCDILNVSNVTNI